MWRSLHLWMAVGCALLAGVLTLGIISDRQGTEPVAVLNKDLPPFTVITDADLAVISMARVAIHPAAVRSPSALSGRLSAHPLYAGEQVLVGRLLEQDQGVDFLAALLPGERAMAVPLALGAAIAGAVKPYDHVDLVYVASHSKTGTSTAKLLLKGGLVLAVWAPRQPAARGTGTDDFKGLVVAVSQAQAEALAHALEYGRIYALLVPPSEAPKRLRGESSATR